MSEDTKDMVYFLMPDGKKVSNDPRFGLEEALQEQLDSREYNGDAGVPLDEQKAQVSVERLASIQSGQPGVGENATVDDPVKDAYGPLGSPAQQVQKEDVKEAKEAGADASNPAIPPEEPVDSNEAVEQARKARKEAQEAARRALEKLGDDGPGDPEQPYSEWTGNQLKAEALRRNAEREQGDQLDLTGIRKKSQLVELLEKDDDAHQGDGA